MLMSKQPGYISASFHKSKDGRRVINYAQWRSPKDIEAFRSKPEIGKKTLLIAGVATEIIVQHSALSGAAHGYHVEVVVDACGGLSPRTEDAALRRLTQAGVVTTSVASIAGQLAGDFTQPKGGRRRSASSTRWRPVE